MAVAVKPVGTPTTNSFVDTSLTPNTAYFYKVRAVDATAVGPLSGVDWAMTVLFTDDPLGGGSTTIRGVHLTELRSAVNVLRTLASLQTATFTDASLAGKVMKPSHINELRAALDAARAQLGLPPMSYTDPTLVTGMPVKAVHIRELRAGLK
jgi:hypothetical protein